MKTRRKIYLILGITFIVLNCLSVLGQLEEMADHFAQGTAFGIGYLTGSFILAYIGGVFLYFSNRLKKKIRQKEQRELEDTFMADL